jgi:hypothetical protein
MTGTKLCAPPLVVQLIVRQVLAIGVHMCAIAAETAVGGNTSAIRQTLTAMVTAGWVVVEQKGKGLGHFHSLTPEGIKYFSP